MSQLRRTSKLVLLLTGCVVGSCVVHLGLALGMFDLDGVHQYADKQLPFLHTNDSIWSAPKGDAIQLTEEGRLIRYGKALIEHTATYLGPKGKVGSVSNGMNCQNCHLAGGTKLFGNSYALVASKYPTLRKRSGKVESIERRINDCFQRSLNGEGLDTASKEMRAMVAYIKWIGKDISKREHVPGSGLYPLPLLERAASPVKGKVEYATLCARCHGNNGQGLRFGNGVEWKYPPLWGPESYNTGAGLYRISRFAAFIKANMPYGISHENPLLTNEESWDIAAYVNSMPRPHKVFKQDWPDISTKPMDHPFGPYADSFTEREHKYGPFGPIVKERKQPNKN